MAIDRAEGQIWIDKGYPNRLKYYVNNKEYTVEVSGSYLPATDESTLSFYKGMVVALDGQSNTIHRAVFPEDLDSVIGIIVDEPHNAWSKNYSVGTYGEAIVDASKCFYNYTELSGHVGAPVYWYSGRINTSTHVTSYDSSTEGGLLTIGTPLGIQHKVTEQADTSLDVGFDNLPQIGVLTAYDSTTKEATIYLNFSKFDTSLEWNWPRVNSGLLSGSTSSQTINIYPGLFIPNVMRNVCDITASSNPSRTEDDYTVFTSVKSNYSSGLVEVTINNLENAYYKIAGRVNYKFK